MGMPGRSTSPDQNSVFKGSVNASGNLVGTGDEKGVTVADCSVCMMTVQLRARSDLTMGFSDLARLRHADLLPLKGVYRLASNGATRTGVFAPDYQLQDGTIADPFLMFPRKYPGGKI